MNDDARRAEDAALGQPDDELFDWLADDPDSLLRAQEEIEMLRVSIANMFTEMEDILTRQNPRIESDWQIVVGVWENKLLEAQIDMRRAKRRYNLVQAKANTGSPVDLQEVETQLDEELAEWTTQLDEAVGRYHEAVSSHERAVFITSSEAQEHKRLFRILAKRLHPDLHPDSAESSRIMFSLAQRAYRAGDLKMLQSLEASSAHLDANAQPPTTVGEARSKLVALQAQVHDLEARLEHIKQEPPYCLRAKLDDTAWVEAHVAQLKKEIDDCMRIERRYERRSDEIAGAHG